MVGIVNYGMGNLLSVFHAVEMAGDDATICDRPEDIQTVDRVILPGVGAFGDCMANLKKSHFIDALQEYVYQRGNPILGICLGMQAMARRSFEDGEHIGLGWFDADVQRVSPNDPTLRVPHVGWNEISFAQNIPIFSGIPTQPDVYFVHSYCMNCDNPNDVVATCDYGGPITAAVCKNNILATQFHPEKSQDYGLRILDNFLRWSP